MAKTMAFLQAFHSSLLPRLRSRALIPFPFPFERLPRRLSKNLYQKFVFLMLDLQITQLRRYTLFHSKLQKT